METSRRERIRQRQRRSRNRSIAIWTGLGIAVLGLVGLLIWPSVKPAQGETVPVMESVAHVQEGEDPGPFNTDPPSSGPHYASPLEAGFYHEEDLEDFGPYPEGHIVHSLEHGYVVFWYNCDAEGVEDCDQLKADLQEVIESFDTFKVIAFPWDSLEEPVVITSWGRMHRLDSWSERAASNFVRANRGRAPEPNAP